MFCSCRISTDKRVAQSLCDSRASCFFISQAALLRSPVLTAIGLVNRNPAFLTPTESTSLNRSLKNLSQVITSTTSTAVQNSMEIHTWDAYGQIGEISPNLFFIYTPFLSTSPTGQIAYHIFRLMVQMRRTHARVCLFGFRWYCSPFRGSNYPKIPIFGA